MTAKILKSKGRHASDGLMKALQACPANSRLRRGFTPRLPVATYQIRKPSKQPPRAGCPGSEFHTAISALPDNQHADRLRQKPQAPPQLYPLLSPAQPARYYLASCLSGVYAIAVTLTIPCVPNKKTPRRSAGFLVKTLSRYGSA